MLPRIDLPRDERGRVKVDENLRVLGKTNIWAGGDCAADILNPDICAIGGISALLDIAVMAQPQAVVPKTLL